MDADLAKAIRAAYWSAVDLVPASCRYNFRAIWCDYRLRMYAQPARAAWLLARVRAEVDALLSSRTAASLPPALWRRPDEDAEAHLDRCYQSAAGKWTTASVSSSDIAPIPSRTKETTRRE